jgi:GNAT superfamily N-acetyltransferase
VSVEEWQENHNSVCMIEIDLLKNHSHAIPAIANIWHEVLGKIWMPEIEIAEIESLYYEELNEDLPLAYIALYNQIPVGTCSLQLDGGIRPDLEPWLGDLVVDPKYQKRGIGKMLINAAIEKAKDLGYEKLYLFTFDPTVPEYYQRLGWKKIGMDEFKSHPVTVMAKAISLPSPIYTAKT